MPDFPATSTGGTPTSIEVRYNTDYWGVYSFNFENAIASGATIGAVTVRAFEGTVRTSDDISDQTEISALLIDPGYTPQISGGTSVLVRFQFPGATYTDAKATVVFEVSSGGGTYPFFFPYVRIKGQP